MSKQSREEEGHTLAQLMPQTTTQIERLVPKQLSETKPLTRVEGGGGGGVGRVECVRGGILAESESVTGMLTPQLV